MMMASPFPTGPQRRARSRASTASSLLTLSAIAYSLPDTAHLTAHGEIDLTTADAFGRALSEAARSTVVEVDLTDVSFMDARGVGALVGARRDADPSVSISVVAASGQVRRVLETTGLSASFGLPPDEPEQAKSG
jgi:anti-anti-sigma factor